MNRLFLAFIVLPLLHGCATVISGSEANVAIDSYPPKALVTVTSTSGRVFFHGEAPTNIRLPKGGGYFNGAVYFVSYKKDGYQDSISRINSSLNPWYIANIFNIFGFFTVDPMTGSMWDLEDKTGQVLRKRYQ